MPTTALDKSVPAQAEPKGTGTIAPSAFTLTSEQEATALPTAQTAWANRMVADRLAVLKRARHLLALRTDELCAAISSNLARNPSDTRVAEILPLLAACKFLEREAPAILAPRRLGRRNRPFWLMRVWSEVHRVPFGRVLVIAPSNYPLFLAGVQVLQALAAGNAVIWKPGRGGRQVARIFAETMQQAGLQPGLLEVTDESIEAAQSAIASGVDKVFFTGSVSAGRALLHQLAETLTPCVAELSGCDAVFILSSAELSRVAKALAFGMRLNGSATCMAPRRIFLIGAKGPRRKALLVQLLAALGWVKGVRLPDAVREHLHTLVAEAIDEGAELHGNFDADQRPLLLTGVKPSMNIAKADLFAPLLSIIEARSVDEAVVMNNECAFALTASIFGDESEARSLAKHIPAGTVAINDLMVPAADPRIPFGGIRQSGFGVTRGAEGLLEMTTPKTIAIRRGSDTRHFDATTAAHLPLFDGIIHASHAATWKQRLAGVFQAIAGAKNLNKKN